MVLCSEHSVKLSLKRHDLGPFFFQINEKKQQKLFECPSNELEINCKKQILLTTERKVILPNPELNF